MTGCGRHERTGARSALCLALGLASVACFESRSELQRLLDLDEVRQVATGIVDADNAGDLERVLAFYAVDAVLLPPGEPAVRGIGAIRPRYEALFASYEPAIAPELVEAEVAGDLAYAWGRNGGVLRGRHGIPDRPLNDVYLMVLRRADGGGWKITRLMWHPDRPPAPPGS